jgi:hypothetical protein
MHHPVIRCYIVQSSVVQLFSAHGPLFLTARHRSGIIVEGGNTRVESETCACAVAEIDSFANTVLTAYYTYVLVKFVLKKCVCNFLSAVT